MATTLKVKLEHKIPQTDEQTQLSFVPDYDNDANKEWAKFTPALSLSFIVRNDTEAAGFEVGQTFTVTLEENTGE